MTDTRQWESTIAVLCYNSGLMNGSGGNSCRWCGLACRIRDRILAIPTTGELRQTGCCGAELLCTLVWCNGPCTLFGRLWSMGFQPFSWFNMQKLLLRSGSPNSKFKARDFDVIEGTELPPKIRAVLEDNKVRMPGASTK